jgi:hypothetical protein
MTGDRRNMYWVCSGRVRERLDVLLPGGRP